MAARRGQKRAGKSQPSEPAGRLTRPAAAPQLLEYSVAKVALEDDYAAKLLAMKGSVADDVDL